MKILKDERGIASAFAVAFGAMVVIAIVWNFFSPVMENFVFGWSENKMKESGNFDQYSSTWSWSRFIWRTWPIFMLVGLTIYMFLAAQRPSTSAAWWG